MKISPSNLGVQGCAQAFNARSLFPYVWAWDAVGATFAPSSVSSSATVLNMMGAITTISSDPKGIKHTADAGSGAGGYGSYIRFTDENTDPISASGKLDNSRIDFNSARYLHGVYDMSGWSNFSSAFGTQGPYSVGSIYYYDTGNNYNGLPAKEFYARPDGMTIIVWDMHVAAGESGGATAWKDMTIANSPTRLEPYWGTNAFNATQYMIWCGMVLSDRIHTDIPLPIRTHMG